MQPEQSERDQTDRPTKPMRALSRADHSVDSGIGPQTTTSSKSNRGSCLLWAIAITGVTLAIASLIVNGLLVLQLRHAGEVTGGVLDEAMGSIDSIPREPVNITVPISQTIEFSSTIPFSRDFEIPFQQNIAINQTVRVWVEAGLLGRIPIDIPIYAAIPIDLTVPVSIDQEFPVRVELPVRLDIPITVDPEQWGVGSVLLTIRRWLATIRELM
jgi:hypothetical protein